MKKIKKKKKEKRIEDHKGPVAAVSNQSRYDTCSSSQLMRKLETVAVLSKQQLYITAWKQSQKLSHLWKPTKYEVVRHSYTRKLVIMWPIVDFRSVRRKAKPEIWLFFKTESLNLENNPNQNNLFDHFEANLSNPLEAKANKTHISNHSPTSLFLFLMVIINNVPKGKKLAHMVCFIPTENIHLKYNLKLINFYCRRKLNPRFFI